MQWLTGDDKGVQGVTGDYSGTLGMCTVVDRGLQGVQWLYTLDERENTGGDRE